GTRAASGTQARHHAVFARCFKNCVRSLRRPGTKILRPEVLLLHRVRGQHQFRLECATMSDDTVKIGLVSISDRASKGVYQDQGIPALQEWFQQALSTPWTVVTRLIPDEQAVIEATLRELSDEERCHLVLTTGGTGPAPRDVTPEATIAVADKVMPGFGEQMRQISLHYVPTAILSRQVAVVRGGCLIVNLPGQPKSIRETLEGVEDAQGKQLVHGIFAAIPYCIDLIGGPYIETTEAVVKSFRPKSALRPRPA